MTREVVFVGAARTAIGSFGGSLKDVPPADLGALVIKTALERAGVAPKEVGHVVFGNVIPSVPQDAYISRVAALNAGCPIETPAFNVNRLCGSGLQAIVSAAQAIQLGDCDVAVGGGAESMSRGPYFDQPPLGRTHGRRQELDYMLGILHDPAEDAHGHHRRKRGRALRDHP
jgi:acetyl-CoA C-acetyltransferase